MQHLIFFDPIIGMAAVLAVLLGALIALEIYNGKRVQKLAYPAYEYALKNAEQEADRILDEARREARHLIEKAEAESLALAKSHTSKAEAAVHAYEQTLQGILSRFEKQLQESARTAQEAGARVGAAVAEQLESQGKEGSARLAAAYEALETGASKRIDEQIARAFAAAEKEAQDYERARKEAIDKHVLALVGETVKLTLRKSLSSDAHADLVRAALEEAKASNVF